MTMGMESRLSFFERGGQSEPGGGLWRCRLAKKRMVDQARHQLLLAANAHRTDRARPPALTRHRLSISSGGIRINQHNSGVREPTCDTSEQGITPGTTKRLGSQSGGTLVSSQIPTQSVHRCQGLHHARWDQGGPRVEWNRLQARRGGCELLRAAKNVSSWQGGYISSVG